MKLFFGVAVTALLFSSCQRTEDCSDQCDLINPEVLFVIKNSSDKNLVCGPDKIYTSDQLKIKAETSSGLINIPLYFNGADSTSAATGLFFISGASSSKYYLYINDAVTDSMEITHKTGNPPRKACCPPYTSITALKLNTVLTSYVYPDNTGVITIVK
ncbi:hypothetical protein ACQ33O_12060 [Ferruginibacter sp. SUN002]|uniref:hypothetical protein n=1 Tax=Ferruginibacter sp. SUN002 TaxID=2937789 RepID=UPI003D362C23